MGGRTGFCTRTIDGHDEWIRSIAISSDGLLFASASSDKTISVWKFGANNAGGKNDTPMTTLTGHEHVVECIAFLNDLGDKFLSRRKLIEERLSKGTVGDQVQVHDIEVNDEDDTGVKDSSNVTMYIVSGSRDRTVRVWNVTTSNIMQFSDHENRGVVVHPSGKHS